MENTSLYGQAYDNFINSLKSEKTKQDYSWFLKQYVGYESVNKLEDLLNRDVKKSKEGVKNFILFLKNEKQVSYSYRRNALSAIRHFYEMNDVVLPWLQLAKFIGEREAANKDRPYTHEEIKRMVDYAKTTKFKAIIALRTSAGLRLGAIPSMLVGDLTKIEDNIFKVVVYGRTKDEYYTFCSPEAYSYIMEYLEYRKRKFGEVITPESPLFRQDGNTGPVRHLSRGSIKSTLRKIAIGSGVAKYVPLSETNKIGRRRNLVALTHGTRKFFVTQSKKAKVELEARKQLTGHSIGVEESYVYDEPEDRLPEYLKAVDNLTINDENRLKVKVKQLQKEKDDKIAKLEGDVRLLDTALNELWEMQRQASIEANREEIKAHERQLQGTYVPGKYKHIALLPESQAVDPREWQKTSMSK